MLCTDKFRTVVIPLATISLFLPGYQPVHAGGCSSGGDVIFDNTQAVDGNEAIRSNFAFTCGDKSDTGVKGSSGNAINITDFQVLDKGAGGNLVLTVGESAVSENNYLDPSKKLNYFKAGEHLFDIDRYRTAADWLSANTTPDDIVGQYTDSSGTTVTDGSGTPLKTAQAYGTLSMMQFLENVSVGATMYGIVRVKVPVYYDHDRIVTNADASPCATTIVNEARTDPGCYVDGTTIENVVVSECATSATGGKAGTKTAMEKMMGHHNCFHKYAGNMDSTTWPKGQYDTNNTNLATFKDRMRKGYYFCSDTWKTQAGANVMDNPRCVTQSGKAADGTIISSIIDIAAAKTARFCGTTTTGLCGVCAPGTSGFDNIVPGTTACGYSIGSNSKIAVKGSLLWDFVDQNGAPLQLSQLPVGSRILYFQVEAPITVNADESHYIDITNTSVPVTNFNGSVATIDDIRDVSDAGVDLSKINWDNVPQSSKDDFKYRNDQELTETLFDTLPAADRYHLLMPSGYADAWADAFNALNLTSADWLTTLNFALPGDYTKADGTKGLISEKDGSTVLWQADDFRSNGFEDIPAYMYTGGLIDMHHHVNISGLIYVPQAMELEAKQSSSRQYVNGGVILREGFYIEAQTGTVTLFVANHHSYSQAVLKKSAVTSDLEVSTDLPGTINKSAGTPPGYSNRAAGELAPPLWVEIQPNI